MDYSLNQKSRISQTEEIVEVDEPGKQENKSYFFIVFLSIPAVIVFIICCYCLIRHRKKIIRCHFFKKKQREEVPNVTSQAPSSILESQTADITSLRSVKFSKEEPSISNVTEKKSYWFGSKLF